MVYSIYLSLVSSIASFCTHKALAVKTAKPNFVAVFVLSGTVALFMCEISSLVAVANRKAIVARDLPEFGVSRR